MFSHSCMKQFGANRAELWQYLGRRWSVSCFERKGRFLCWAMTEAQKTARSRTQRSVREKVMGGNQSKVNIKKKDLEFLRKNTKFSDDQIRQWYRQFMVTCPDGTLTRTQFVHVYEDFFPSGDAKAFCEHAFRTFDTNDSGQVDFKEFLSAINVMSNGSPEQKLEWAFKMYDIDGSGTIEEEEMVKIMQAVHDMFKSSEEPIDKEDVNRLAKSIFAKMDKNNDKSLTFDEFMQACMNDAEIYQLLTSSPPAEAE